MFTINWACSSSIEYVHFKWSMLSHQVTSALNNILDEWTSFQIFGLHSNIFSCNSNLTTTFVCLYFCLSVHAWPKPNSPFLSITFLKNWLSYQSTFSSINLSNQSPFSRIDFLINQLSDLVHPRAFFQIFDTMPTTH